MVKVVVTAGIVATKMDDDVKSVTSGSPTPMIQSGQSKHAAERQQRRRKKHRLLLRMRAAEVAVAKQADKPLVTGAAIAPLVAEAGADVCIKAETGQDELASALAPLSPGKERVRPGDIQAGDVVILGAGVPPEFRRSPAVVTKVAEMHCTVMVLDELRRSGRGECWPCYADVELDPNTGPWRIGERFMIEGLTGNRTKHLNGFSGVIALHPREGHPCFVRRPADPDIPQLTLCIRLDDPAAAGQKGPVLLEPRFLTAYEKFLKRASADLEAAQRTPGLLERGISRADNDSAEKEAKVAASSVFSVGQRIILDGLSARKDLNGIRGTLSCFDHNAGRWVVTVDSDQKIVKVKEVNLLASTAEVTAARKSAPKATDPGPTDFQQQVAKMMEARASYFCSVEGQQLQDGTLVQPATEVVNRPQEVSLSVPQVVEVHATEVYEVGRQASKFETPQMVLESVVEAIELGESAVRAHLGNVHDGVSECIVDAYAAITQVLSWTW